MNPLDKFHNQVSKTDMEAVLEVTNMVGEWFHVDDAPIYDLVILSTMSKVFQLRLENEESTVQASIDMGNDPEIARNTVNNLAMVATGLIFAAYNIGRNGGAEPTQMTDEFKQFIASLDIE